VWQRIRLGLMTSPLQTMKIWSLIHFVHKEDPGKGEEQVAHYEVANMVVEVVNEYGVFLDVVLVVHIHNHDGQRVGLSGLSQKDHSYHLPDFASEEATRFVRLSQGFVVLLLRRQQVDHVAVDVLL